MHKVNTKRWQVIGRVTGGVLIRSRVTGLYMLVDSGGMNTVNQTWAASQQWALMNPQKGN